MSAKFRNVCVSDGRMMPTCDNQRATNTILMCSH